ncbi:unnamed protein product [Meloidogyne enterolobii]|uniref:Uncharacterized protein n=1 Tax=Meloidogyne enterolobii TaxID=390850 RepID=A0ACB0ZR68_MELEN
MCKVTKKSPQYPLFYISFYNTSSLNFHSFSFFVCTTCPSSLRFLCQLNALSLLRKLCSICH